MEIKPDRGYEFYKKHIRPEGTIAELRTSIAIDGLSLVIAATPVLQNALEMTDPDKHTG